MHCTADAVLNVVGDWIKYVFVETYQKLFSGAKQSRTEWHNITAWNKLAEICGQYLKKGGLVYLEGSIKSHQWQDQAGAKRSATEIVINQMQMLGGKPQSGEDAAAQAAVHDTTPPPAGTDPVPEAGFVDEEIPF